MSIDSFLINHAKKIPWLGIVDHPTAQAALQHFSTSCWWTCGWAHLCRISPWFYFSALVWIAFVIWKELFEDGHLKRIMDGTESEAAKKDMIADLITKLGGLPFYLLGMVQ